MEFKHKDITDNIIRAFYNVNNTLGYGFLEKVYENSMLLELTEMGLSMQKQYPIDVYCKEKLVGSDFADLIVEEKIFVELKAAESICEEHESQLINYLKAADIEIGLLLNFGKETQFERKIFTNIPRSSV